MQLIIKNATINLKYFYYSNKSVNIKDNKKSILFWGIFAFLFLTGQKSAFAGSGYQDEGTAFYAQKNSSGYVLEGTGFYAENSQVSGSTPIYRFYNATTGDHFYTASEDEKNSLVNNAQSGYSLEDVVYYAFATQVSGSSPVYRFVNPTTNKHFYTISEDEKNLLVNNTQWGFQSEGVAFYAYSSQINGASPIYRLYDSLTNDHFYTISEDEKNKISVTPVYRFYNAKTGDHFYTISEDEKTILVKNTQGNYLPEGVAFYANNTQASGSVPVYRLYNSTTGDHFYTISEDEKNALANNSQSGYASEGVAFYAYASQVSGSSPVYRFFNSATGDHFYTISEDEKNYLILSPLGPDISVGLWYFSKTDIQNSPFEITANKNYNIKDANGNVLGQVNANSATYVSYRDNGNLDISGSISDTSTYSNVTFDAVDGDNTSLIFDVHRPGSSLDHYRDKIKVQYYRGPDIYGGNTGNTVTQIWVINILPLEQYVWGAGELTGTGPIEHTKVMTTIFRTYGYWYVKYATKYAPYGFKIRSDSGSQVYNGYDWEAQYSNIKTAAQATRGIIVGYSGDVALTPYSSYSDGRTRSYEEVWGSTEYPWCQSVSDPYGKYLGSTLPSGNHMVGLIAHGSLNLADDSYKWDYQRILKYYYTGISLNTFY